MGSTPPGGILASLGTYVSELSPTLNYNTAPGMALREGSGNDAIAYLYWSRPFPLKATILTAKIVITSAAMPENVTHQLIMLRMGVPWSQTKMTWNTRPTTFISGSKTVTKTGPVPGAGGSQVWEFDVTDWMATVAAGGVWQGVQIKTNEAILRYLYGEQNSNVGARPRLEVTWSDNPATPRDLAPSGGRAVATNKPTLKASYLDVSGSTSLAAVRVQLSATQNWTTPDFDSGNVGSAVPELNLANAIPRTVTTTTTNTSTNITAVAGTFEPSDVGAAITGTGIPGGATLTAVAVGGASATLSAAATASGSITATVNRLYAGLADGATTFWRIQLQDAAGLWSPWSLAVSFKRDDRGTLVVDSPPVGTPTVEDATPPILWTFTGETQAAYQVWIQHTENGVLITDWTSGKIQTSVDDVTVPAGKITDPGITYTLTLRVWDTKQREPVPGFPVYVEVVRTFTFVPGATTGTTGLTAVQDPLVPKVLLTWQRTSAPDRFNVLRNGKVIAAGLLPETEPVGVFVSGTTYRWTDHSPSPGRSTTYSVQAVVNNVASTTNATVTGLVIKSWGIWLREPVSGLELMIVDKESRSFIRGEQSGVLRSIAPDAPPVMIRQSLGTLEGKVGGMLESTGGKTAQQWRDIYFKLQDLGVKKLLVTVGDYTFWAVCNEFTYEPLASPAPRFKISFSFYQQDRVSSILMGS